MDRLRRRLGEHAEVVRSDAATVGVSPAPQNYLFRHFAARICRDLLHGVFLCFSLFCYINAAELHYLDWSLGCVWLAH